MTWPWTRRSPIPGVPDASRIQQVDRLVETTDETGSAVDAIVADHERILARDEFGATIAAALRLRRVR